MKIFDFNWFELKSEEPLALTIGTFDGVHKGHQSILKSVVEKAHQKGLKSAILTFSNHPRLLLNPHAEGVEILQTAKEKLSVFEEVGIDMVFYLDLLPGIFDFQAHRFVEEIIIEKLQAQFICIGYDHRFGKNRGGDIHLLKQFQSNFEVLQIPVLEEEAIAISSTRIREALRDGKVQEANALLGRKYPLTGQIIHGNKWGRTIGFPTANIQLDHPQKLIPKVGIYAAEVYLPSFNKSFLGMLYIGYRTGLDGQEKRIEVHLFDFDEEIYGQEIQVQMHAFIREDQVVASLTELIPLLEKDKQNVLEFFAKQNFVA